MAEVPCPLCSRRDTHAWFEKHGCAVQRCPGCTLVFTAGDWSTTRARDFYGSDYFSGHDPIGYANYHGLEAALRTTARSRLQRLPPAGRLLDIGCGFGVFADEARRRFETVASDVSLAGTRQARERGLDVVVSDAASLPFADASFDAVTLWDTIEHLATPLATLREVRRVLRPGGMLALSTGDVASCCARLSGRFWHLFTLPEHRFFFSLSTLDRFLALAGLQRHAAYHRGAHYSLAYLLERIVKSLGGDTRRADRWLRRPRLNRHAVYVNLFDIITVEAVKPSA